MPPPCWLHTGAGDETAHPNDDHQMTLTRHHAHCHRAGAPARAPPPSQPAPSSRPPPTLLRLADNAIYCRHPLPSTRSTARGEPTLPPLPRTPPPSPRRRTRPAAPTPARATRRRTAAHPRHRRRRAQDAGGLQPDLLAVRVRCRPRHVQRRRLGREQAACGGTCVQNKQAYKEAGTCTIYACASSRLTTHTTARAHA